MKSATINAEKALKERQSRFVCGFVKLKAKIIKIAELMITNDHKPYADSFVILVYLRRWADDCHDSHRAHHEEDATMGITAEKYTAGTAQRMRDARSRENRPRLQEIRSIQLC